MVEFTNSRARASFCLFVYFALGPQLAFCHKTRPVRFIKRQRTQESPRREIHNTPSFYTVLEFNFMMLANNIMDIFANAIWFCYRQDLHSFPYYKCWQFSSFLIPGRYALDLIPETLHKKGFSDKVFLAFDTAWWTFPVVHEPTKRKATSGND